MSLRLTSKAQQRVRVLVYTCLLSTLMSCGFALRQSTPLPLALQGIQVSSLESVSELQNVTMKYFAQRNVRFDNRATPVTKLSLASEPDDISSPRALLLLAPEKIERRLLSVFSTGQVAEYELNFVVRYTLRINDIPPQSYTLNLTREYQDDPKQVLAKSRELNLILNELREEAAATIWQRLPRHYNDLKNLGTRIN